MSDALWTHEDGSLLRPDAISKAHAQVVDRGRRATGSRSTRGADTRARTLALEAGVPIVKASCKSGHASTAITQDLYIATSEEGDAEAAETLAAVLHGASPARTQRRRPRPGPIRADAHHAKRVKDRSSMKGAGPPWGGVGAIHRDRPQKVRRGPCTSPGSTVAGRLDSGAPECRSGQLSAI